MHMLLTSLSAIYQAKIPILQYGQRHIGQMSRAHLRYVLTGEIAPWIDKLITYLSDPAIQRTRNPIANHAAPEAQKCPNKF
jgi:hypothetical protein